MRERNRGNFERFSANKTRLSSKKESKKERGAAGVLKT